MTEIDVCERPRPATHQVNETRDRAQYVESPQSVAIFPDGSPVVAFASVGDGATVEAKGVRVDLTGQPQDHLRCSGETEMSYGGPNQGLSFMSLAGPPSSPNVGVQPIGAVAFTIGELRSRMKVSLLNSGGCNLGTYEFPTGDRSILSSPALFAHGISGTDNTITRFALFWTSTEESERGGPVYRINAYQFYASHAKNTDIESEYKGPDDDPIRELAPAWGTPVGIVGTVLEEGVFALLWFEHDRSKVTTIFAIYDDHQQALVPPVVISEDTNFSEHVLSVRPHLALAFDGQQLFALWSEVSEDSSLKMFGRYLSPDGIPLSGSRSPNGEPFRVGSSDFAIETSPSVTAFETGGFFVAWQQSGGHSNDTAQIRALLIDPYGNIRFSNPACGQTDFGLSPNPEASQTNPSVATGLDNSVVAVWTSDARSGGDYSETGVRSMVWRQHDLLPKER